MRTIIGGLLACLIGSAPLQAGSYPDRPITIVVPFGKGTTADLVAAVVSETMSANIGQKVIVELKPEAGGGIAMEQVQKAAPDGYTLAMITQGTHVFNLSLYKTLRYDPRKIIPITPIAAVSNVMTVHPSNPANTPFEVAAAAKATPGQLTYASGGVGTSHHLGGVLFASIAGVDIKHVPHLVSVDGMKKIVNGGNHYGLLQPADRDRGNQSRQTEGARGDQSRALPAFARRADARCQRAEGL